MALIEFKDYPDTTTPQNSENLNINFNYLDEKIGELTQKNIITASTASNFTKSSAEYEVFPINSGVIVGDKLTIKNNSIIIGNGISKVKISGKLSFNSIAASGLKWLTIFKNNDAVCASPSNLTARNTIYSTVTLVEVAEGDLITLKVNGSTGDIIRGGIAYSNITVEVVE